MFSIPLSPINVIQFCVSVGYTIVDLINCPFVVIKDDKIDVNIINKQRLIAN